MDDLEKLVKRLEGSKTLMQIAAQNGVGKAGLLVEGDAKRLCPVDTGRLRSSLSTQTETTETGAAAFVGTNVEYAPYVEYGTGQKGDPSVPHRLDWAGMPPQPFLRPALELNRDNGNIEKVFSEEVRKVFE